MYKFIAIVLVIFSTQKTVAQAYDHLWFTGYNEFPGTSGSGYAQLRFETDSLLIEPISLPFNFESTVAVMSDSIGKLLFYTNGCAVANREHVLMPNGSGLNPGEISDQVCPWKGYIVPQGAMILPKPAGTKQFYILHSGAEPDPVRKIRLGALYYTVIDLELQNGLGDVVSKNQVLIKGDLGAFTSVRHGNGRDWWIVVPDFGNRRWHTFLLSPAGIEAQAPQLIPLTGPECEKFMATAVSRKGDKIANWGDCKVTILEFDRCSGGFNQVLELQAPTHWIPGGGLVFSPSGRYLYASSQNVLFRADLEASKPKLDTMRYSYDPFGNSPYDVPGNTFHYLTTGPDGNIYGNIPSRASYLHRLKNADGVSIASIDFKARSVKLPVKGVRTLPHLPNYRLYDLEGSPCDTLGISVVAETPANPPCEIMISPNPARIGSWVDISACPEMAGSIFDTAGRKIEKFNLSSGSIKIKLSDYRPGIYFIQFQSTISKPVLRKLIVY